MPALIVDRIGPLATIQDHGRRGRAHEGIPPSGPLDPETYEATVQAASADAAIELPLLGARFAVEGSVVASIDGEEPRTYVDWLEVPRGERAVRYLAVRGGFDVPLVLGARATLVNAGLGGFHGRPLARGDRVPVPAHALRPIDEIPSIGMTREAQIPNISTLSRRSTGLGRERHGDILVQPTDDTPHELFTQPFRIDPRSDRVGTRLTADRPLPVAHGDRLSRPLVPGAIQLPPDGHPIVIGPDGPTTGGYVVIGVLRRSERAWLARLRPGSEVRFRR